MGYKRKEPIYTSVGKILDKLSKLEGLTNFSIMKVIDAKDFLVYEKYLVGELPFNIAQIKKIIEVFDDRLDENEKYILWDKMNAVNVATPIDTYGLTEEEIEVIELLIVQFNSRGNTRLRDFISNYGNGGGSICRKIAIDEDLGEMPF